MGYAGAYRTSAPARNARASTANSTPPTAKTLAVDAARAPEPGRLRFAPLLATLCAMKRLEFWFDFSSPFAYLGSTQVARIARQHEADLVYRPFLLGGLFKAMGTPLVPLFEASNAKQQYLAKDLRDWATHWSVPFEWPSRFPLRTIKALRLVLAAPPEQQGAIVDRLMRLCWAEDGDPDDEATLARCLSDTGASPTLLARTQDPEIKDGLKQATEEAAVRAFPGAPIFVVGDVFFWGQDRLHFVEKALAA